MASHRNTDIAWLAGFLDGEGSFQIVRYRKRYRDRIYEGFSPQVTASGTEREPLDRCKAIAGGVVAGPLGKTSMKGNAREWFRWRAHGKSLGPLLAELIPYLTCKREHAELLLVLRSEIKSGARAGEKGRRRNAEEFARREDMKLVISALNHRGSTQPPAEQVAALQKWRSSTERHQQSAA